MISALGAIHCITKEIGVYEPVFFSHPKVLNTLNTTSPYEVKSYIKIKSGVSSAKVYWRTDTTQSYNEITMTQNLDTFRAEIPAQQLGSKVYYYISATSNSNRTVTKPLTAPQGYYKFVIDNPTSVNENTVTPLSFELSQNFPNPFNPNTKISYSLQFTGEREVNLSVYDVLGNEVATLVNGKQSSGSYSVEFNGSNFSSGIYFYRLSAGEFNDTKRMVLIK
ncbi:MAG: T9SS type A sorting domain-containing protein [Bacteroidetes bacterium]|nr:T9SS type A sorting domain-containing protein [Bacteroidota bacterium]